MTPEEDVTMKFEDGESTDVFIYQIGCSLVNIEQVIWKNEFEFEDKKKKEI